VRPEIAALTPPAARYGARHGPLHVLVVGGSLGAAALNEVLPRALALLPESERPEVVHQSGAQHLESLRLAYEQAGVRAHAVAGACSSAAAARPRTASPARGCAAATEPTGRTPAW
jgi:UDP-N-acetylglucosamine--N-acetylmuramyl-(pentapeptide) pyrophosphoryl-undecaprenol N-acetylglucosamine transferase